MIHRYASGEIPEVGDLIETTWADDSNSCGFVRSIEKDHSMASMELVNGEALMWIQLKCSRLISRKFPRRVQFNHVAYAALGVE